MKRKSDFLMQNVGGELILVPLAARVMDLNGLITLNETAAYAWELLSEERSLDDLTAALTERFDVAAETAREDLERFVEEISRLGLLAT